MFGGRPRYDDTFGVRLDLGGNRKDPLSSPKALNAAHQKVKQPVLIEKPWRLLDIFGSRDQDPLASGPVPKPRQVQIERPSPPRQTISPPHHTAPSPDYSAASDTARQLGAFARSLWNKLSLQHRIVFGALGVWFLLSTGLIFPAIVLAVIITAIRNRQRSAG